MHRAKLILGLAVMSVATGANAASWTGDSNGSWADGNRWAPAGVPGAATDVTFDTGIIGSTTARTVTLDGEQSINSLTVLTTGTQGNRSFTITPGSPAGSIILNSGNLTLDGSGVQGARLATLTDVTLQIGAGATPVTNAAWHLNNSNNSSRWVNRIGAIKGIAGTVVTLTGNNSSMWAGNSSEFFGELRLNQNYDYTTTGGLKIELNSNNATGGAGSLLVANAIDNNASITNLHFTNTDAGAVGGEVATSHDTGIRADSPLGIAVGVFGASGAPGNTYRATLNGNLSGSQSLNVGFLGSVGSSGYGRGTLVLAGSNNTLSGDVSIYAGSKLQVDGTWTGAGNVQIANGALLGSGNIGLAENKTLTVGRSFTPVFSSTSINTVSVIPGTQGALGTLTVGTPGNANTMSFTGDAAADRKLLIDIDGLQSDQLVVNGDLVIDTSRTFLEFNTLSTPTAAVYVIASWTGSLTGAFAAVSGIPDDYELQYTSNQLLLINPSIPEPTTLAALALVGGMLSRRRRH